MPEKLAILGGPAAAPDLLEYQPLSAQGLAAVTQSLRQSPLTSLYGGWDVSRFEAEFAGFMGARHAVAMTSGTSALHAAVAALNIGPGDEVITPTYSFVASASIIAQQGATPVFCDIEASSLNLDVRRCRELITPRTRAIVAVHVFGKPADVVSLRELCDEARIALIEDCASAPGARIGGRCVGTFGDIGCFSFNVHKIIRTGEGGMAITADDGLALTLRELRVNGLNPERGVNNVVRLGFNYTMAQYVAALGCSQMQELPAMLEQRARNQARIEAAVNGLPVAPLPTAPGTTRVGYWTPLLIDEALVPLRPQLIRALRAEGVFVHGGYGQPLYKIEYLAPFAAGRAFPVSEAIAPRVLAVDPSSWYSDRDVDAICAAFHKVFGQLEALPSVDG